MGKLEFTDLGPAEIRHTTAKAALVLFEDGDQQWVPFSVLATPTAAECEEGNTIERFRVETWFADKME